METGELGKIVDVRVDDHVEVSLLVVLGESARCSSDVVARLSVDARGILTWATSSRVNCFISLDMVKWWWMC